MPVASLVRGVGSYLGFILERMNTTTTTATINPVRARITHSSEGVHPLYGPGVGPVDIRARVSMAEPQKLIWMRCCPMII